VGSRINKVPQGIAGFFLFIYGFLNVLE